MLIMKITTNDEYYYVEKENNQYSVLCINNEKDYYLNSQEWDNLVNEMLGGEKQFLERKDGYDIYIDSMNNKRYFKDGIEDIEKLFNVNSTSALLFQEETNSEEEKNSKKIILDSKKKKRLITYIASYAMITIMIFSSKKLNLFIREKTVEPITLSQMQDYIEGCETYEDYQKQILANMNFLEDVYSIADEKTRKELALTYKKLGIEYFPEQEKNSTNVAGYVSLTDRGMIHLRDKDKQKFYDNGPHEFVHVNQQNMIYNYVDEAVAEIAKEEYFNYYATTYYEARKNISILMEIIGPEPIMRLSFNNEIENFEEIIKTYLDKEDAKILLNEFKLKADKIVYNGSILKEADHELIREMLGKMYEKKYPGKKMEDDPVIKQILNNNEEFMNNRYYFNQRSEKFYASKNMFLPTRKIYDKNIEKSISLISYIKTLNITKEEAIFIIENNQLKDDDTSIVIYYEDELGENKNLSINKYSDENEIYNAIELLNNSDIKLTDIEKEIKVEQRPSEENTIPTIFRENKELQSVNILYNNKASGLALRDDNGNIYIIKSELIHITSVAEKFPSQVKRKKQLFNNYLDYYMIKDNQTNEKEKEMKSMLLNEDYPLLLIDNAFYKINEIEKAASIYTSDYGIEDMRWISVLMEIIGPSPIKDYYYSKNSTIIRNAINEYLDNDEVDELLREFQKAPEEADYEKIKKLIAKLYENVNPGHMMEEDPVIFGLVNDYNALRWTRNYFNDISQDKENVDIELKIPYDNNFENNLSNITITYKLQEINSEEETINSLSTDNLNDNEYIIINYEELEDYNYEQLVITKNTDKNKINNFIEKIRNGEIIIFSTKKNKKISLPPKPGIIKEKLLDEETLYITIKYKDGYTGYVKIDEQGKIRPIKIVPISLQPIQEKFPEQNEYFNKR